MAITNLDTAAKNHVNSVRDLQDASEVVKAVAAAADATLGASFTNTGSEILIFTAAGGNTEDEVYHIKRSSTVGEVGAGQVGGTDIGDDSGNAYDVVTVPSSATGQQIVAVGPFDPKRYGTTVTVLAVTSVDQTLIAVLDIRSRRQRSTLTR